MQFQPREASTGAVTQLGGGERSPRALPFASVQRTPPTSHRAPLRSYAPTTASSPPGSNVSSAPKKPTKTPFELEKPLFIASKIPSSFPVITTQPCDRANSTVPSVLPPSTTTCSTSTRSVRWRRVDSTHSARYFIALSVGVTTVT